MLIPNRHRSTKVENYSIYKDNMKTNDISLSVSHIFS